MRTWLITGCSKGFGRGIARRVLEAGDNVVLTARDPATLRDLAEKYPDSALALKLDVNCPDEIEAAVAAAKDRFGTVDVLVNNAGYCLRGAVEECDMDAVYREYETNLFGPIRLIRAVLPMMRAQRSGLIVNFSSVAAISAGAGSAYYGSAKAAIEGLSEGLQKEVAPLGIRIMIVEPAPFPTDFHNGSLDIAAENIPDYAETSGKRKVRREDPAAADPARKWGNVEKGMDALVSVCMSDDPPFRLPLGSTAIGVFEKMAESRKKEIEEWKDVILSADD